MYVKLQHRLSIGVTIIVIFSFVAFFTSVLIFFYINRFELYHSHGRRNEVGDEDAVEGQPLQFVRPVHVPVRVPAQSTGQVPSTHPEFANGTGSSLRKLSLPGEYFRTRNRQIFQHRQLHACN